MNFQSGGEDRNCEVPFHFRQLLGPVPSLIRKMQKQELITSRTMDKLFRNCPCLVLKLKNLHNKLTGLRKTTQCNFLHYLQKSMHRFIRSPLSLYSSPCYKLRSIILQKNRNLLFTLNPLFRPSGD